MRVTNLCGLRLFLSDVEHVAQVAQLRGHLHLRGLADGLGGATAASLQLCKSFAMLAQCSLPVAQAALADGSPYLPQLCERAEAATVAGTPR